MKNIKSAMQAFAGLVLLIFIVLGAFAYFTSAISVSLFVALAFILVVVALADAYFGWLAVRAALLYVLIAAVMVVGVVFFRPSAVKASGFQAVFLTNGQVYFGHLKNDTSREPYLTDVYYLQSNQQNPQTGQSTDQNQSNLSLVKLGNELQGPEDKMVIKSNQILFWENLKDNGKVVQAIKQNQQKK